MSQKGGGSENLGEGKRFLTLENLEVLALLGHITRTAGSIWKLAKIGWLVLDQ